LIRIAQKEPRHSERSKDPHPLLAPRARPEDPTQSDPAGNPSSPTDSPGGHHPRIESLYGNFVREVLNTRRQASGPAHNRVFNDLPVTLVVHVASHRGGPRVRPPHAQSPRHPERMQGLAAASRPVILSECEGPNAKRSSRQPFPP